LKILATTPHHIEGWLHVDLPQRVAQLGYPLTTITASHAASVGAS